MFRINYAFLAVVLVPQTEIYVDVDEVPVTGISASERVSVTASATVNNDSAKSTLVSFGTAHSSRISLRTIAMFVASVLGFIFESV